MYGVIVSPGIWLAIIVISVLPVWAAIDAAAKPAWAFERAGTSKTMWIVLPVIGVLVCGFVGVVSGIVWFASTRAKVAAATSSGLGSVGVASVGSAPPVSPAGWYADPARRHELRYFDGASWTSHVSDQGSQSHDPV